MNDRERIDPKLAEQIIQKYIESSRGIGRRQFIGRSLVPLRRGIDYQSVARKTLMVDELPKIKCPECGHEFSLYYDAGGAPHPENGCSLGHIYNVMES